MAQRRSKYGVRMDEAGKAARTVDNVLFASLKESRRYQDLKLLEQSGHICFFEWDKRKLRWPLEVNGKLICTYEADFAYYDSNLVQNPRHGKIVEDCKGFKTPAYRLKKKLMLAIHKIEIQEV